MSTEQQITTEVPQSTGTLVQLMQASTATIKRERANHVLNSLHTCIKSKIDECHNKIAELRAKKAEMIHKLLPTNVVTTDFEVNAVEFANKRAALIREIINESILFEGLKADYLEMFGKQYEEPQSFLS